MAYLKTVYKTLTINIGKNMDQAIDNINIFLIGDSTMSHKDDLDLPERGWGIDLESKARKLILDHGVEDSNKLFVRIDPGLFESFPEGLIDNKHLSIYGATLIACLAVEGIKELDLAISRNIK